MGHVQNMALSVSLEALTPALPLEALEFDHTHS